MLASIDIKNVALIESLQLNFGANLNAITGETGSGKSIMLNALKFVVGDRLDKSMIRQNADFMKVDAFFVDVNENVQTIIKNKFGLEIDNGEILISREYDTSGKTCCRVNGQLTTTGVIKDISSHLIDMHGQHEHQMLFDREFQLKILDGYCKGELDDKLAVLNNLIDDINEIDRKLKELGGDEKNKQNLIDLYKFQLNEINEAKINKNEYEELTAKMLEMRESEKITSNLSDGLNLLNNNSYSQPAIEQISQALKQINSITHLGEHYKLVYDRLNGSYIELKDIIEELDQLKCRLNFDESEFKRIDERIDTIKSIFKKYGGSFETLIEYKDTISKKLNLLLNAEEEFGILQQEKNNLLNNINEIQETISQIRKKYSKIFEKNIEIELSKLGMKNAKFYIKFEKISEQYSRSGFDFVDFMFSANLGFDEKPLNKIASGGEISRFMLAYKIVANELDYVDTLIFDEIDTGISGNIANVVAECMGKLARNKQMIVVSHLPQICAVADTNFIAEKFSNETTKTSIKEIKGDLLYNEISRLMGLTDNEGYEFAKTLKNKFNNLKQ